MTVVGKSMCNNHCGRFPEDPLATASGAKDTSPGVLEPAADFSIALFFEYSLIAALNLSKSANNSLLKTNPGFMLKEI